MMPLLADPVAGVGQGGAKQGFVYMPPRVCPTGRVLLVILKN